MFLVIIALVLIVCIVSVMSINNSMFEIKDGELLKLIKIIGKYFSLIIFLLFVVITIQILQFYF